MSRMPSKHVEERIGRVEESPLVAGALSDTGARGLGVAWI